MEVVINVDTLSTGLEASINAIGKHSHSIARNAFTVLKADCKGNKVDQTLSLFVLINSGIGYAACAVAVFVLLTGLGALVAGSRLGTWWKAEGKAELVALKTDLSRLGVAILNGLFWFFSLLVIGFELANLFRLTVAEWFNREVVELIGTLVVGV